MTRKVSMGKQKPSVLIIGYGNPGRQDDGLGPACASKIKTLELAFTNVDISYQLVVEHAYDMSSAEVVVFVDATRSGESPFSFGELKDVDKTTGFGSHTLTPSALKKLTNTVYGSSPKCYVLGIRGYQFDQFEETLSAEAESNLSLAVNFMVDWIDITQKQKTINL